ncbi:polysaccharide biosynthesis C-terminal domain-containing protein [Vibrio sp. J2-4]|uniref:lipopolysaccharide biosynthesis protein n=1 Tax=Vibrio TaxID=662 RepID=UPI001F44805B|nr:polysaccharide biosynthesis C-terminal domain-containing protein [Vibrio sp. J2-4]MCF7478236.1 polysaccharide biosynthesis C-terminal domain-containing protein [Vibrio sp. J2-4]
MNISSFKLLLLKPVVIYLLADVLVKSMQFFLMPTASHLLSIDEYGKLTLFLALLTALVPVVSLSSESAFSIFYNQELGKDKKRLFINSIMVAATGYVVFTAFTLVLSYFDDNLLFSIISLKYQMTKMLLIAFLEYFFNIFLLSSRLDFKKTDYFFWFVFYFLLKFLFGLGSIYIFESSDSYLNSILFLNTVFALFVLYKTFEKSLSNRDFLAFDKQVYLRIIKYSMMILPVTMFSIVNSMIDKVYITSLLSVADLANYTSIFLLSGSIQIVILAMNKAYMPKLLKLYSQHGYLSLDKMKKDTQRVMVANYFIFLFCIIILPILFGYIYSEKITFNYGVFLVLSLSFLLNTLYILFTNVLSLDESTAKYKMFGFLFATFVNVPLSYFFTLKFGILGASISTLASCTFAAFILFLFVNVKVEKYYLAKDSFIFFSFSLSTVLILFYFNSKLNLY